MSAGASTTRNTETEPAHRGAALRPRKRYGTRYNARYGQVGFAACSPDASTASWIQHRSVKPSRVASAAAPRGGLEPARPAPRWAHHDCHVVSVGLPQPADRFVVHWVGVHLEHVAGSGIPRDPRQQRRPGQVRQNKGRRPGRTTVARLTSQRSFHTSAALYPARRRWGAPTSSTTNTGTGNGRHFRPLSLPRRLTAFARQPPLS